MRCFGIQSFCVSVYVHQLCVSVQFTVHMVLKAFVCVMGLGLAGLALGFTFYAPSVGVPGTFRRSCCVSGLFVAS